MNDSIKSFGKTDLPQLEPNHVHLRTFIILALFWTAFIVGLSFWEYRQSLSMVQGLAITACETAWQKDLLYRRWASGHGGVYVPVTEKTPPNPDLKNIPEREITTPSGRLLTLMNPAYMNRQVYDLARDQYGVRGHITSLTPLRAENRPDPWEAAALTAFESGAPEIHSLEELAGQLYMRSMRPLTAEKECLECHRHQGYKVGDIRGGISISVPWEPYKNIFVNKMKPLYGELVGVWVIGVLGLIFSMKRINTLFSALKNTQAMLVHQEKMASLGQMTAGIAHEINNPLAFVLGNEQLLQRDFDDLLAFVKSVRDALPEIATISPRIHSEISAKAEAVGLEYLAKALPRKITANIEGLERVKAIILDLRNFSRLDEAEQKLSNLSEGIKATLRFLGPLLHEHGVTVETDFAPLPELLCSPGPLNQAFSNVLANAVQASTPGQIVRVSTRLSGDWYVVEVADQGGGISAEHLKKVFDPFFTTKPVGSGTGLGLSITNQVVAAHGGKIEIDSIPGSGTTVRILLPAGIDLTGQDTRL